MTKDNDINYDRIGNAIEYLEANFRNQPNLDEVAEKVHVSPYHFQRIFTEWAGISPKRFLQYLTVNFLKKKLAESKNLEDAAASAGLSGQSRVYDLFTTLEGMTPQEYKLRGSGIQISYGFHETRFGQCLIGVTERGICWMSFLTPDEDAGLALEAMKTHWYNSIFREDAERTGEVISKVFEADPEKIKTNRLHLFVKGTNFQIKVWEALLRIPSGNVATYQNIADAVHTKGTQAVGSACGANHIAYIIPCHRVIRKDGVLGEYRWHPTRKKSMIGWEMSRDERGNNV